MTGTLKVDQIQNNTGTSVMTFNTDGIVKRNKIPMLKVGFSGTQNLTSGQRVIFNSLSTSDVFDPEDNMSGLNTSNGTYNIPAECGGLWHISVGLYTSNSTFVNQIAIYKNGTREDAIGSNDTVGRMNQGAITKRFEPGDTVAIHIFNAGTSDVTGNKYHTWWQMNYLG